MARGDEAMDRLLRRRKERSGRLACLAVGAAHTLDNEAPRRVRIGGIAPRRRFQHRDEAFRDRAIGVQQIEQRDRAGTGIAIENAAVELGLAAEGGIEAGRVYPDRLSQVRDADGIIATRMEQPLGGRDRFVRVEQARSAACAG